MCMIQFKIEGGIKPFDRKASLTTERCIDGKAEEISTSIIYGNLLSQPVINKSRHQLKQPLLKMNPSCSLGSK